MKSFPLSRLLLLMICAFAFIAQGADKGEKPAKADKGGKVEKATNFDSFKLLRSRNIFDPNRRSGGKSSSSSQRETSESSGDSFTLTGILVHDAKSFAFFSGSRQSKVVHLQGSFGGARVISIQNTQVELERDGKHVIVPVGKRLRIQEDGNLEISTPNDTVTHTPPITVSTTSTATAPTITPPPVTEANTPDASAEGEVETPPPAGDSNDLLKKMMEKRQKELSK
jgi:hypothetical protein